MRKNQFLTKASLTLLSVVALSCFSAQHIYGQSLISMLPAEQNDFLYTWCSAIKDSNNLFVDLPLLRIKPVYLFVGPCFLSADSIISGIRNTDLLTSIISDADSTDNADKSIAATPPDNTNDNVLNSVPRNNGNALPVLDNNTEMLVAKYTEMINISPDDITNMYLYKFVDNWYGVRYKYGGNDNNGIDCSAFSQKLYGSIYSLNILRTARQQHRTCDIFKDYGQATEGDLIFFRVHHLGISHVGVYLANGYFVHASRSKGVVISSLDEKYWRRRYAGCGHMEREDLSGTESGSLQ